MKKGLITIILTFILIFNTYSPTFATSPDPGAAIPLTYEVYTYFTLVLTYMGVEFKNAQERKQWLEDEYGPNTPTYQSVEDILRQAKINFSNEPPNYNPKPEPRQIAIPVPDNLIDNLYNKLKDIVYDEPVLPSDISSMYSDAIMRSNNATFELSSYDYDSSYGLNFYKFYFNTTNESIKLEYIDGTYRFYSYSPDSNGVYDWRQSSALCIVYKSDFKYFLTVRKSVISFSEYNSILFSKSPIDGISISLPKGDFIKSWTSPYSGMQTVTMPLTTTGIESPVEIPVIPGEYVELAPDEVTNPIQNPENDPLINPETGLPFIDPETGLPIFPSTPLVPVTPITPIPEPEELTQPNDYTPNLTEISNGIKQLPERIINPIKKLFIPDTVSKIDFSPLNVPVTKKFPFSIPFDLANMFQNFSAGGEPPKWDINLVFMDYSETVTIDLARFEKWAEITRFFVFIAFNIGLILVTRNLIRG